MTLECDKKSKLYPDGVGPKFFLFSALGMVIVMGALVAPAMG